jgi:CDP-diglyceride synthetase
MHVALVGERVFIYMILTAIIIILALLELKFMQRRGKKHLKYLGIGILLFVMTFGITKNIQEQYFPESIPQAKPNPIQMMILKKTNPEALEGMVPPSITPPSENKEQ